jgi:hypothetical protein
VVDGVEAALAGARNAGAALIAAHPYCPGEGDVPPIRPTQRFSRDWRELAPLVDRWELFNRRELFAWVAERELAAVASGDLHQPEHLFGWKTLLPCAKREDAVVEYLRSTRPAFLTRIDDVPLLRAA